MHACSYFRLATHKVGRYYAGSSDGGHSLRLHQVFFNGARLPVKGFQDYVALYLKDPAAPRVYERVNERWEVCVCASEGQFQQACCC